MASPPLETIPEAPTPPNSPTPARVTTDSPKTNPAKNPRRVAAGKKLAEDNRRAREALKKVEAEEEAAKAKAEAEAEAEVADKPETSGGSSLSLWAVIGIGGLVVSVLGVYYQREAIMSRLRPPPQPAPAPAPTPTPSHIPVKQGLRKMR